MKPFARWSSFAILPAVAFFEGAAWYGTRTVLSQYMVSEGGSTSAEVGTLHAVISVVGLVGTVLAGLGAIAIGPWAFMALGTLVACGGALALGILPPDAALLAAALLSFGHGLLRPTIYGAGARAFGDDREHLRSALFLLLWGSMNLAGWLSPMVTGSFGGVLVDGGAGLAFVLAGGSAALAFLLATGLAVAVVVTREKDPAKRSNPPARGVHLVVVFGIVLVVVMPWGLVTSTSFDHLFVLVNALDDPDAMSTFFSINPLTVMLACAFGAVVLVVLHVTKVRLPTLLLVGLGLVILGAGMVMMLLVDRDAPSVAAISLALVTMAVGEVLVGPLLLSRVTGDLPYRLETLVAALWIGLASVPSMIVSWLDADEPSRALAWSGVIAVVCLGCVLVAAAFPLRRVFAAPGPTTQTTP